MGSASGPRVISGFQRLSTSSLLSSKMAENFTIPSILLSLIVEPLVNRLGTLLNRSKPHLNRSNRLNLLFER
jgi:hypothetical protein